MMSKLVRLSVLSLCYAAALAGCSDTEEAGDDDGGTTLGCGNGVLESGELCDDGNLVGGDGCSARCLFENPVCGNGRIELGETCDDGNTTPADGCSALCLREGAVCGNGVKDGNEECDDGNMVQTDECLNTCRSPRCGDGNLRAGVEECDSGAANSNTAANACRLDCKNPRCGDGVKDTGAPQSESCDDGNTTSNDGCSATCVREPRCGDSVVDMMLGETCDDGNTAAGDGCSPTCTREPRCGDGMVDGGEQCDDANTAAGDGCSPTCSFEPGHFYEREPNGTAATANTLGVTIEAHGAISPTADVDYFQFTLMAAADIRIEVYGATGVTSCIGDPEMDLVRMNGATEVVLVTDDDDGAGLCPLIDALRTFSPDLPAQRLPAGTYYVKVYSHSLTPITDYRLKITLLSTCGDLTTQGSETCDDGNSAPGDGCDAVCLIEPECGNSRTELPEQCDDGNTSSGDGCSAMCRLEFTSEVEPNDVVAQSTPLGTIGVGGLNVVGAITPVNELDFYSFRLDALADVRIETFDDTGPGNCATSVDTIVQLRASDGATVLVEDDNDGVNNCSLIDPALLADTRARGLRPGTYYIRVIAPLNRTLPSYRMRITLTERCGDRRLSASEFCDDGNSAPGDGCDALCRIEGQCGNGRLHAQEQCDDGNLVPGDGCSAQCDAEVVGAETELNDTFMTANAVTSSHGVRTGSTLSTDQDWYTFTLTAPTSVLVETFDASGPPTCDIVDTTVTLLASDGTTTIVTDFSDGPGNCAMLDPALDPQMRNLAAGTYYLRVVGASSLRVDDYRLRVRFYACGNRALEYREFCDDGNTTPGDGCSASCLIEGLCGDRVVQPQESCDDGNTTPGDGCDASCRVETTAEVEANNTFSTANVMTPVGRFSQGTSNFSDQDWYSFTLTRMASVLVEVYDADGPPSCDIVNLQAAVYAPDGVTQLATDFDDGPGFCPLLSPDNDSLLRNLAPGTYFVRVLGELTTVDGYRVRVRQQYCGDGAIQSGEFCDDGNTAAGDGCDATCRNEGVCGDGREQAQESCDDSNMTSGDGCDNLCRLEAAMEVEVNNVSAMATPITPGRLLRGVTLSTDPDFYSFTLATPANVRVDVWDNTGPYSCDVIDVSSAVMASNGISFLASDSDDGPQRCPLINPYEDTTVRALAAGTYYVRVTGTSSTRMDAYTVLLTTQVCGNSRVEWGEQCDDGNAIDTDACQNVCMVASTLEVEPNEDGSPSLGTSDDGNDFSIASAQGPFTADAWISAAMTVAGDEDVYALRNPTTAALAVWLETSKGTPLACTGVGDTVINIRDAGGNIVAVSDDDGVGLCSAIRVSIPAMTTLYAHIVDGFDDTATPNYYLRIDYP